ncbi:MAG: hypothetical protein ACK4MV_10080 [Beijerinckiaceae bacterium]
MDDYYKRSQVEHCLWNVLRAASAPFDVPRTFRFRIKKLLDIDRQLFSDPEKLGRNRPRLAFNDALAGGNGIDVPFSEFHVFMMGLALEMWNAGFKQTELVLLLQRIRRELERKFKEICEENGHVGAQFPTHSSRPLVKDETGPNLKEDASARHYMIIDRIELPEVLPRDRASRSYFEPVFVRGAKEFAKELGNRQHGQRSAFFIELAALVAEIRTILPHSVARRRGPAA